jgi:hypothetical protein
MIDLMGRWIINGVGVWVSERIFLSLQTATYDVPLVLLPVYRSESGKVVLYAFYKTRSWQRDMAMTGKGQSRKGKGSALSAVYWTSPQSSVKGYQNP